MFLFIILGDGTGLSNGWSTWYNQSGFIISPGVSYGDIGYVESYHITSLPEANVSLTFNGVYDAIFSSVKQLTLSFEIQELV